MRIACPFCGDRDLSEFSYLGDGTYRRPDGSASDRDFYAAVYLRDNVAGAHAEFWYHQYGCRRFLRVHRDTRTHQILAAELAHAQDPA